MSSPQARAAAPAGFAPENAAAWKKLQQHRDKTVKEPLQALFAGDAGRFKALSLTLPGLLADFSKNHVTRETIELLCALAREAGLEQGRDNMFAGTPINTSENRAVLHTALRAGEDGKAAVDGHAVAEDVHDVLQRMQSFTDEVRDGVWRGYNGKDITDIVNIGIGGSSLGPRLAVEALAGFHAPRLQAHFVANVEASELALTLKGLSPETTLFIVASKTFTTAETMQNARLARDWIVNYYKDEAAVARHFVAASTNAEAVKAFGISPANMFPFWDWVGGRYSLWSAIGLPIMLLAGAENFEAMLEGAREMDEHFRTAPLEKNIPALMGLIGLWYRDFLDYPAYAVIPYHAGLARLPAFLQQLDMESNGKSVARDGRKTGVPTGPIVFGEPGTDAQHSFFQWLHQGSDIVPVEFIAAVKTRFGNRDQQAMLLANMLAQAESLLAGRENKTEPHRNFPGNRPSTTLLLDELDPKTLGMLLALYEHRVFVQGWIWGINSFDQWGVELGKVTAKTLEAELKQASGGAHDASTQGLLEYIRGKKI
jgi:glucose-6-phosphate isomerase